MSRYSKRYPSTAPELKIVSKKGLSENLVKELTKTVRTKATTLLDQEMIYELTQFVRDYLTSHNREQVSFFDAMTTRQEKVKIWIPTSVVCVFASDSFSRFQTQEKALLKQNLENQKKIKEDAERHLGEFEGGVFFSLFLHCVPNIVLNPPYSSRAGNQRATPEKGGARES